PSEGVRGNALSQPTPANQPVPVAGQGIAETNAQFYGSAMPSGAGVEHVYWLIAFEFPTNGNTRYLLDSTAATGLQIGINASGQVQVNNKNTSNLWNGTLAAAQPHLFAIKTAAIGTGFRGSIDGATEVAGFGTSGLTGAGTIKLGPVGLSGSPGKIMVVARLDPTLSAADLAVAIGTMAWATGSQGSLDDGFAYKNNAPIL
ncbi:MAG TPA: hypothetical protein VL133_15610, partial [Devosia sp.]|nr:hypothetical protein [Devosia sp.]